MPPIERTIEALPGDHILSSGTNRILVNHQGKLRLLREGVAGPAGPAGPAGATGATGPAGPEGKGEFKVSAPTERKNGNTGKPSASKTTIVYLSITPISIAPGELSIYIGEEAVQLMEFQATTPHFETTLTTLWVPPTFEWAVLPLGNLTTCQFSYSFIN